MKNIYTGILYILILGFNSFGQAMENEFVIYNKLTKSSIVIDENDFTTIKIAANLLAQDIEQVTGYKPFISSNISELKNNVIIIGSIEKNMTIKDLVKDNFISADSVSGKWETYSIKTLQNPYPNIEKALVIFGSDRRGTAYGVFDISERIGVSPWYWWADVKPEKKESLVVPEINYISKSPSVKYRGIFINDEDWGLQPWAAKTFEPETGDIGPKTYAKIFELLLRLKTNLIWPAMHNCTKAFYYYPENRKIADDYGIVIGTSHCEQMLCNNVDEWKSNEYGEYNYITNKEAVYKYWENRAIESQQYENIYTIGMRGIHDSGIEGVENMIDKVNIMNNIIIDQRKIIQIHINENIKEVPQAFIPYKEVLEIYDNGLELPDDITIVWPDDNYGYIRRLNNEKETQRQGGAGIYYHISYWGRPHDYLWLSSTHPSLICEEMLKAYQLKSDKMWVLNVGDLKPMEYNTQLFLDMAYSIDNFFKEGATKIHLYNWILEIFGEDVTRKTVDILWEYYNLAFERRPEFMGWNQTEPTRMTNFTEYNHFYYNDKAQLRIDQYNYLSEQIKQIYSQVNNNNQADAFYQLVYYPVICAALINQKLLYLEKAYYYARQNRASANDYAIMAKQAYDSIVIETEYFNNNLANGKWKYMISMEPRKLPAFQLPLIPQWEIPDDSSWGLALEGNNEEIPHPDIIGSKKLPEFNPWTNQKYFVDIFLKGKQEINWKAKPSEEWIVLSDYSGTLNDNLGNKQQRVWVSIDWSKIHENLNKKGLVTFSAAGKELKINIYRGEEEIEELDNYCGFIENNRYISIFAENFNRNTNKLNSKWQIIDGLGHTGKSISTFPLQNYVYIDNSDLLASSAYVEYDFYSFSSGKAEIEVHCIPGHPINNNFNMRFGITIDNNDPQILDFQTFGRSEEWKINVLRNSAIVNANFKSLAKGKHVLRIYAIDPGVIIDRITIDFGGLKNTYGVIPETRINNKI